MYIYSPHTALDVTAPGLNDWLAECFVDPKDVPDMKIRALRPSDPATPRVGQGRLLELAQAISLESAVQRVKQHLGLTHVRRAEATRPIRRVALCAGSGSSVLRGVEADLFLTGELGHHDVLAALAAGTHVILTEHSNSERGYLHRLREQLGTRVPTNLELRLSRVDRDPLQTI
jgi:putative NIF3 family GTP cyclohydrolase 1 type 2